MPSLYMIRNKHNEAMGILPYLYSGSDKNDNPEYMGSSKSLQEDIARLGACYFEKTITKSYDDVTNRELRALESEWQQTEDHAGDPVYYNKTNRAGPACGIKGMKHSKKFERSLAWKESRAGWIPSDETRRLWSEQRTGHKHSKETRQKMSLSRSGSKNGNALTWTVIDPKGTNYTVSESLKSWCKEMNVPYGRVYNQRCGWIAVPNGQGKGGPGK